MVWILSILWVTFAGLVIIVRFLEKEHSLAFSKQSNRAVRFFYPFSYYLLYRCGLKKRLQSNSKVGQALGALEPSKQQEEAKEAYFLQKLSMIGIIFFLCLSITYGVCLKESISTNIFSNRIKRPSKNATKQLSLRFQAEDISGVEKEINDKIIIEVKPRPSMKTEHSDEMQRAYAYLESVVLGDNLSARTIYHNLYFPLTYGDDGTVSYRWVSNNKNVISDNGIIHNLELAEPVKVVITAEISICDIQNNVVKERDSYELEVIVHPYEFYVYESWMAELNMALEQQNQQDTDEYVLPTKVGGRIIEWEKSETSVSGKMLFLCIAVCVVIFFVMDEELNLKVKKRNEQLLVDYPEIIHRLTLLLGAGMTVSGAFHRMVEDYLRLQKGQRKGQKFKHYVYEEMLVTRQQMLMGVPEQEAIELFGNRIGVYQYLRLSTLLTQNMKKGNSELTSVLEQEAMEAFQLRKEIAKKLGEEASTKLLVPMFLMLVLVMLIIMIPAFLSMQL